MIDEKSVKVKLVSLPPLFVLVFSSFFSLFISLFSITACFYSVTLLSILIFRLLSRDLFFPLSLAPISLPLPSSMSQATIILRLFPIPSPPFLCSILVPFISFPATFFPFLNLYNFTSLTYSFLYFLSVLSSSPLCLMGK